MSPGHKINLAGVAAAVAGPLLVVSLYFSWWGLPDAVTSGAAEEAGVFLEGYAEQVTNTTLDGWEVFSYQDVVWLITGIAGLVFGLAALTGVGSIRQIGIVVGVLTAVSAVLLVAQIVSPPDHLELAAEFHGEERIDDQGLDFSLSRKVGPWVALVASSAIAAACALRLSSERDRA